jgi:hypothetical protein
MGDGGTLQQKTELRVQLEVTGIDPNHPLAEQAYEEFVGDADSLAGVTIDERTSPTARQKGALSELVLIPGAPSVAWSVVTLVKLWLQRDQKRSVEVTVVRPGQDLLTVRASGEKISVDLLEQSLKAALQGEGSDEPEAEENSGQDDAVG